MKRLLLSLSLLFGIRADVVTHFAQATEIGVEQLPKYKGTDKITFFSAIRAEKATSEHEYVLSFGEPKCEQSCAQSVNAFCTENRALTDNWEQFSLDHYPDNEDPAAVYIRRTLSLEDVLACSAFSVTQAEQITYTGTLVLSLWEKGNCETCPTFKPVDSFDFTILRNATAFQFEGLSYNFAEYEYSAEATRNIRIDGLGLFVEISTTLKSPDAMRSFETMTIAEQDCVPRMKLLALTDCLETDGTLCTQRLYLTPEDSTSSTALASGTLEIHASFADAASDAVLHVEMNIDTATDYGAQQRPVDVVVAVNNTPYIQPAANMVDNEYICVALASPALAPLALAGLRLCAATSVQADFTCSDDSKALEIFSVANNINLGTLSQADNQASYCFNIRKIQNFTHVLEVSYSLPKSGSSDDSSGIVQLQRRSMYDNDVVTTQSFWIDCPHDFHWDEMSDACVHDHGHDHLDAWEWVFLVLLGLVVVGIVICTIWGSGCSYHQDSEYLHPYWVRCVVPDPHHHGRYIHAYREQHSGKIVTNIHIDPEGNEVVHLSRKPVHKHKSKR